MNILISWFRRSLSLGAFFSSRRLFFTLLPPLFKKELVFDRRNRGMVKFQIRNDTDRAVFDQVFLDLQYETMFFEQDAALEANYRASIAPSFSGVPLILDLGSNNGISSKFFSLRWPGAKVVGVEPHEDNFRLAKINAPDCEFILAAASGAKGRAEITNPEADEWGFRVSSDPAGSIETHSVVSLLDLYKSCSPFILKLDVEGSEDAIFEGPCDWIDDFPLIIIELHDWMLPGTQNSKNFLSAIAGRDRDFVIRGENVFSFRN